MKNKILLLICFFIIGIVFISGCGKKDKPVVDESILVKEPLNCNDKSNDLRDGEYLIEVPQPGGFSDKVWVYVASPKEDGNFPIVIYGKGQGAVTLLNCHPDGPPNFGKKIVDSLAKEGFVVVSLGYRNDGSGAPSGNSYKQRDHYIYDARTFLAAAEWARTRHSKANDQVAFIGSSMGTWPALWAVSEHSDLKNLQQCLDTKTVILQAESANHLANIDSRVQDLADGIESRPQEPIIGSSIEIMEQLANNLRLPEIREADLTTGQLGDQLSSYLTPAAIDIILKPLLFQSTNSNLEGCNIGGKVPFCNEKCTLSILKKEVQDRKIDANTVVNDITFWLNQNAIDELVWWNPPNKITPSQDELQNKPLLKAMIEGSSAYSAQGPLKTKRALHLLSTNDHLYNAEAQELLLDSLNREGIEELSSPSISVDNKGRPCEHGDYLDATRPKCGFSLTIDELNNAFN